MRVSSRLTRTRPDPLARQSPVLVLVVAGALFAGVFCLRLFVGDPIDAYSMFYVLPVALLATSYGVRGGVAAGLLAVALIVVWTLVRDVSLSPAGWASRAVPLILLGALLGEVTDRLRQTEAERRKAADAALLHREAIEINDSIIQGMAAAKWAIEAGRTESGLQTLDDTMAQAQELVSGLIRRADMARGTVSVQSQEHSAAD